MGGSTQQVDYIPLRRDVRVRSSGVRIRPQPYHVYSGLAQIRESDTGRQVTGTRVLVQYRWNICADSVVSQGQSLGSQAA